MGASQGAAVAEEEMKVREEREGEVKGKAEKAPRYVLIIHNDPINGMWWVTHVLMKVLGCGEAQAVRWMMQAHRTGRAAVWSGALEVAELKAEQIRGAGPDPGTMWRAGAREVGVTVERE